MSLPTFLTDTSTIIRCASGLYQRLYLICSKNGYSLALAVLKCEHNVILVSYKHSSIFHNDLVIYFRIIVVEHAVIKVAWSDRIFETEAIP